MQWRSMNYRKKSCFSSRGAPTKHAHFGPALLSFGQHLLRTLKGLLDHRREQGPPATSFLLVKSRRPN